MRNPGRTFGPNLLPRTTHDVAGQDNVISIVSRDDSQRYVLNQEMDNNIGYSCTLELLYKITDIVLVICIVLFVGSAIAHSTIWIIGYFLP